MSASQAPQRNAQPQLHRTGNSGTWATDDGYLVQRREYHRDYKLTSPTGAWFASVVTLSEARLAVATHRATGGLRSRS